MIAAASASQPYFISGVFTMFVYIPETKGCSVTRLPDFASQGQFSLFFILPDVINSFLQRIHLLFHVADQGRSNDVPFVIHHIGSGIAGNIGNKFLIKIIFRIGNDVLIGDAFFLQNTSGKLQRSSLSPQSAPTPMRLILSF